MKAIHLKQKIEAKLPPLAWQIIGLKFFKEFMKCKINITKLTETEIVPAELLEKIDSFTQSEYRKVISQM